MVKDRSLVPSEQAMELFNRYSGTLNIVVISHLNGEIDEAILRESLDLLQATYPRLNWHITGSFHNWKFTDEGTKKISLRVVNTDSYNCWQEVVTEELNQKTLSNECLLRYVLWQNPQQTCLIATIHHGIADGLSAVQLQVELLTYYQKIAAGKSPTPHHNLPHLPAITDLLPKVMQGYRGIVRSTFFLLKTKLKMLRFKPECLKSEIKVPLESRSCTMTQRFLAAEVTEKLISLSKQNKTTIQGVLCVAISIAVANQIRDGKMRNINVSCSSYVDLRRRAEPTITLKAMGIFVSFINTFHTLTPQKSFWELAQEVSREIQLGLSKQDHFKPLRLMRQVAAYYLANPDQLSLTTSVTNLGKLNIPTEYGDLELKEISFLPSNVVFGRTLTVAVTTFKGKMILNFLVSQPSVSKETMEKLADQVIQHLSLKH
ncbi:MAG: condensation domain-containing protein [Spirulinaceae cyanobacterium]